LNDSKKIRELGESLLLHYNQDFRSKMFNFVKHFNHLVFFRSMYNPEEEKPQPYTQHALPTNIASIIIKVSANTKFTLR